MVTTDVQKGELTLWQQQYMSIARELGQWGDLVDFALTCDNHTMMLDALALNMKWQEIRDQVQYCWYTVVFL